MDTGDIDDDALSVCATKRLHSMAFWIGAVLILVAPVSVMLLSGNAQAAWICALCCAFFALLMKVDQLAELSLGPLRAKMREQVREAAATVSELKAVAASTAAANLTLLMAGNFMGGTNFQMRLDAHDRIVDALREVRISEAELRDITSEWRKGIGVIYHRAIRGALLGRANAREFSIHGTPEQRKIADDFQDLCIFERWEVPGPDEMQRFLVDLGVDDPAVDGWISDYRHYLETGEIRRRDLFALQ